MPLSVYEKQYKFCPTCATPLERKLIESKEFWVCPECKFTFWNNPKPVTSVILKNDKGEILMLERANEPLKGYWCLPGGFIQYEEDPKEGAKREAQEEIGRDVTLNSLVGVYRIDNDPRGVNIDIIYSGSFEGNVELSNEHNNAKFFNPNKLPDQVAYKHREAIEDWLNTLT